MHSPADLRHLKQYFLETSVLSNKGTISGLGHQEPLRGARNRQQYPHKPPNADRQKRAKRRHRPPSNKRRILGFWFEAEQQVAELVGFGWQPTYRLASFLREAFTPAIQLCEEPHETRQYKLQTNS
jgi:hypothetical protein